MSIISINSENELVTLYGAMMMFNWGDFPQLGTFRVEDMVGSSIGYFMVFDSKEEMDDLIPAEFRQNPNYYNTFKISRKDYEAFRRQKNMVIAGKQCYKITREFQP